MSPPSFALNPHHPAEQSPFAKRVTTRYRAARSASTLVWRYEFEELLTANGAYIGNACRIDMDPSSCLVIAFRQNSPQAINRLEASHQPVYDMMKAARELARAYGLERWELEGEPVLFYLGEDDRPEFSKIAGKLLWKLSIVGAKTDGSAWRMSNALVNADSGELTQPPAITRGEEMKTTTDAVVLFGTGGKFLVLKHHIGPVVMEGAPMVNGDLFKALSPGLKIEAVGKKLTLQMLSGRRLELDATPMKIERKGQSFDVPVPFKLEKDRILISPYLLFSVCDENLERIWWHPEYEIVSLRLSGKLDHYAIPEEIIDHFPDMVQFRK